MRYRNSWIAGGVLLLASGVTLWIASQAQSQPQLTTKAAPSSGTLAGQIAAATKVEEADVNKVLRELGPAIAGRLARGEVVELPGLGSFRVVRVPEHRDMADGGRPILVPATNSVEFIPADRVVGASNAPGAVPAVVVPPFQYNPLPSQTKGQKSDGVRTPGERIR
jgi:nucleoid DNA-binding protein